LRKHERYGGGCVRLALLAVDTKNGACFFKHRVIKLRVNRPDLCLGLRIIGLTAVLAKLFASPPA
jgi:hypothetical protein